MNKIIPVLVLSAIIFGVLQIDSASAVTDAEFKAKVTELEQKITAKELIIKEQIKVIMEIKDNYKKTYESYSLEQFPTTGGYDPSWLTNEKSVIIDTCNRFNEAGFNPNYCNFVQ